MNRFVLLLAAAVSLAASVAVACPPVALQAAPAFNPVVQPQVCTGGCGQPIVGIPQQAFAPQYTQQFAQQTYAAPMFAQAAPVYAAPMYAQQAVFAQAPVVYQQQAAFAAAPVFVNQGVGVVTVRGGRHARIAARRARRHANRAVGVAVGVPVGVGVGTQAVIY